MAFAETDLVPLLAADDFALWLYRTPDTRATVLSPGYFAPAAFRLLPGHLVILQAGDSLAILPVRLSAAVGNGLVVDSSAPPLRLSTAAVLTLSARLSGGASARTLALGPVPSGVKAGQGFSVQASVTGPVASVVFTILDAGGQVVSGPTAAAVSNGSASASFQAPPVGQGYRVRAQDAAEPLVSQTSPSFVVTAAVAAFALLTEGGFGLLLESGGRLLL